MDEPRNEFERKAATGRLGVTPIGPQTPRGRLFETCFVFAFAIFAVTAAALGWASRWVMIPAAVAAVVFAIQIVYQYVKYRRSRHP